MSKKHDKKDGRKLSAQTNKALTNNLEFNRAWKSLYEAEKTKLHNAKRTIKCFREKLRKFQIDEADKDAAYNELNQSLQKIKEECGKSFETQNSLTAENKTLKWNLAENQCKYAELETSYDRNVTLLNSEISKFKQEVQTQTTSSAKLAEEFASSYNEIKAQLLQSTEKETELAEKIKQLQKNYEKEKETITKLYEERITAQTLELEKMRAEINLKEEQMVELKNEKSTLEIENKSSKDKILELNAKLAAVNRIMKQRQHVKEIRPTKHETSNPSNDNSHQHIEENISNSNVNTIGADSTQSTIRRRMPTRASSPIKSQVSFHTDRNRSIIAYNERRDSSDSDTDISIFRFDPNISLALAPPPQGFGRLKRLYEDVEIPETSDSEKNFDKIKRAK